MLPGKIPKIGLTELQVTLLKSMKQAKDTESTSLFADPVCGWPNPGS
jgi:hypothetical protein